MADGERHQRLPIGSAIRQFAIALLVLAAGAGSAAAQEFDVLLRGGTVIDGTGSARFVADVAVRGDRIALVAREGIDPARARTVLDARGLMVAPGFIDTHAHVEDLDVRPLAESFTRQGVTTVIYAPDGGMPWPLADHIATLRAGGHAPNTAFFAGHNEIRRRVMGSANRAPSAAELERMAALVGEAMDAGAIGLSTGLRYVPGIYSKTEEVIALARVAAARGGFYSSHIRDEGAGSIDAVSELIRIAREAGLPAQLSHHKLMGQPQWGWSTRTLALVEAARAEGLDITIDQYAYDATSTGTAALFPPWSLAGGNDSLVARLADPATRARIEQGMREIILEERGGGELDRIRMARVGFRPEWNGRTFADIAAERGEAPTLDFAIALGIEIQSQGGASGVWHVVHEDDIRRIMTYPFTMISSDGGIGVPGSGHPHPRHYGAFARVLGRYVREYNVLTLEEAIRKMTSFPADRIRQPQRGRVVAGAFADLVVFDHEAVIDHATYEDPHQFSTGVHHVLVNGEIVLRGGALTGEKPGRVLTLSHR
ncbi:MAG: D-aminoacylase [Gemmatimonadetes bacterium]|nr:D-aminoacylase [Gemmatimonadota bacterium]